MGWFKRSVQPQPVATNPLFVQAAAGPAQPPARPQQQQPSNPSHQKPAGRADGQSAQGSHSGSAWGSVAQHCAGMACAPAAAPCPAGHGSAHLRSPAGLGSTIMDSSAQHVVHAVGGLLQAGNSSQLTSSSGGSMRGHAPARLLLPADEAPSIAYAGLACADVQQGIANDEACHTPGAVGVDSQAGVTCLYVPAGICKPQRPVSAAARSVRVSFDTSACQHGTQPSVSWQDTGRRGVSSPGCTNGPSTAPDVCCAPSGNSSLSRQVSGAAAAAAAHAAAQQQEQKSNSRPTSALQRQVQLHLVQQRQQQRVGTAPAAAAAAEDEDDLFAEMCAGLDSLQVAVQLARTESGLTSQTLPAALAAARASKDGSRDSSNSSSRPSSAGTFYSSPDSAAGPGSASPAFSSAASGVHRISTSSGSSADSGDASGSFSGVRQLDRGRSRLQASTSSACMFEEECEDAETQPDYGASLDSGSGLRHVSMSSSSVGGLVMLKVGPNGASVCLSNGARPLGLTRPSSGGSSSGKGGDSSRESSAHKGVRSTSSIDNSTAAPVSVTRPHGGFQEQQQQQQQQKALILQQEQLRLQERRQHKQDMVLASYSCISPSSPTAGARRSLDSNSLGSRGSSRPSSGHVTLAAPQHGAVPAAVDGGAVRGSRSRGFGAGGSIAAGGEGGDASNPAAAAAAPSQCSLDDAWAAATATKASAAVWPASVQQAAGTMSPMAVQGSGVSTGVAGGTMAGASALLLQQRALRTVSGCAPGSLKVPLPPHRALSAVSPRRTNAAAAAAAAAVAVASVGVGTSQGRQFA